MSHSKTREELIAEAIEEITPAAEAAGCTPEEVEALVRVTAAEEAAEIEAALQETRDAIHKERGYVVHSEQPYPHEHGCQGCFEAKRCAVCGTSIGPITTGGVAHCTNGRCIACHTKHCTSGGVTGPGHGYGPALT